jgi:hypothetical protein
MTRHASGAVKFCTEIWICTIATSTIPPLRGPTQSRPSRSPPSIPHLLSPS